eukprot:410951_1
MSELAQAVGYPKIYLSIVKATLSMWECKEPSNHEGSATLHTTKDAYDYLKYYWYASTAIGWSTYFWQLYKQQKHQSVSLQLSKTEITGLIIGYLGHVLRFWAKYTMNRHFTYSLQILRNHKLIQDGPYSLVRHPGYLGDMLYNIGDCLITKSYALCALGLIHVCAVVSRIPTEDALMKQTFGDQHYGYRQKVKYALIPLLI